MKSLPASLFACFILFMSLTACISLGDHSYEDDEDETPSVYVKRTIPVDRTLFPGGRLRIETYALPMDYITLMDSHGELTTVRSSTPLAAITGDYVYSDFELPESLETGDYQVEGYGEGGLPSDLPDWFELKDGELSGISGPVDLEITGAERGYFREDGFECNRREDYCSDRVRVEIQIHAPHSEDSGWSVLILNEDESQFASLYEVRSFDYAYTLELVIPVSQLATPYCFSVRLEDPKGGIETEVFDNDCIDLEELEAEQGCKGGNTAFLAYFPFLGLLRRRRRQWLK